jgi:hypothetical protein
MTPPLTEPLVTCPDGLWQGAWTDGYRILIKQLDATRIGTCRAELEVHHGKVYVTTLAVDLLNARSQEEFGVALAGRNGVAPVVWTDRLSHLYRNLQEAQTRTHVSVPKATPIAPPSPSERRFPRPWRRARRRGWKPISDTRPGGPHEQRISITVLSGCGCYRRLPPVALQWNWAVLSTPISFLPLSPDPPCMRRPPQPRLAGAGCDKRAAARSLRWIVQRHKRCSGRWPVLFLTALAPSNRWRRSP